MILAGVDLAWHCEKNGTAVAVGEMRSGALHVLKVHDCLRSRADIQAVLHSYDELRGVAIDAPLIIQNEVGQRHCERLIGKAYGAQKASCHTSNRTLYPEPGCVHLSEHLQQEGFIHLAPSAEKWQIECYPHPALIEIFGLAERLPYKKGRVTDRRSGQAQLSAMIISLQYSPVLAMRFGSDLLDRLQPAHVELLKGAALKNNEDVLDALICLYIAGLYSIGASACVHGDADHGYIYVPNQLAFSKVELARPLATLSPA